LEKSLQAVILFLEKSVMSMIHGVLPHPKVARFPSDVSPKESVDFNLLGSQNVKAVI
jgi:hypothetical protein